MDTEEAEAMLRALRASLGEMGFSSFASDHILSEAPRDTDAFGQLREVLDQYEAILVDLPAMAHQTMSQLEARVISFTRDPDDILEEEEGVYSRVRADTDVPEEVTLTRGDLEEWLQIAHQAAEVIAEIKGRIDDNVG